MSKVIELNKNNFEEEVVKSEIPVLVDFWAPWCMPCKMMIPVLDEISEEMDGKIKIAKLNTEDPDNQELAIKYEIQSIPNLKLFKKGEVIANFVGLREKDSLKEEIEQNL
ncbi:thioredoxin [bacterium]|nr:thioredoxin [bacterium]